MPFEIHRFDFFFFPIKLCNFLLLKEDKHHPWCAAAFGAGAGCAAGCAGGMAAGARAEPREAETSQQGTARSPCLPKGAFRWHKAFRVLKGKLTLPGLHGSSPL